MYFTFGEVDRDETFSASPYVPFYLRATEDVDKYTFPDIPSLFVTLLHSPLFFFIIHLAYGHIMLKHRFSSDHQS